MKYRIVVFVLLSIIALGAFVALRDGASIPKNKSISGEWLFEEPTFSGLSLTKYAGNNASFYIKADRASIRNRKIGFFQIGLLKIAQMQKVEMGFYQAQVKAAKVESDYATMDLLTKDIFLYGNVRISAQDGRILSYEKARFSYSDMSLLVDGEPVMNKET